MVMFSTEDISDITYDYDYDGCVASGNHSLKSHNLIDAAKQNQ